MRTIEIGAQFGIEHLRCIQREVPDPGPGEVLVQIKAASLNYRDLLVVNGARKVSLPLVPVSDGAGEVIAIGNGVTRCAVGDRVMPTFIQGWTSGPHPDIENLPTLGGPLDGVLVDFGVWHESGLVKIPPALSDIEAACMPCAALSAWNALFVSGSLRPGETVLIQGTGGVSLFGLQFAKAAGAQVIITSSSDEKLERARLLGADYCINYKRTVEWGKAAREFAPAGVDYVIDIGGAATFEQSLVAIRNAGQISLVGFVSGTATSFDVSQIGMKSAQIKGIRVGNRDSLEAMLRAVAHHSIKPVVDKVFAFGDAPAGLRYLSQGVHFGKVCISYS
jgi:NADPH:quinone reductase-like Zn-dependent oxidoreductase